VVGPHNFDNHGAITGKTITFERYAARLRRRHFEDVVIPLGFRLQVLAAVDRGIVLGSGAVVVEECLLVPFVDETTSNDNHSLMVANGHRARLNDGLTSEITTVVHDYYAPNFVVFNIGDLFTTGPEEAAFAVNRLIRPASVIPSHANEQATMNGNVVPGTKTARFMQLVRSADVFAPLSGTVMEFNGRGRCVAGCPDRQRGNDR